VLETLLVVVAAVVVIALATALAPRVNVAGPLVLMAIGLGVSVLPFVPAWEIDPEWILVGILPPLLYSAAVQLPAVEFRRDLGPIAGLSVLLVVLSSLVLGVVFTLLIPGIGLPLGIALGAILSPTDAVATSIAKRLGLSPRVVTMLDGESLLNDATALVLLRTAVAAIAGGFAFGDTVWAFVWAVAIALALGAGMGWVNLRVRQWVAHPAANTALSFTVPFLAYLPTEALGGSGLVASVMAGIVTGQGAARRFTPEQRMSDHLNWRTVELLLEGAVFLIMGLELKEIVRANVEEHEGVWYAASLALAALGITLAVRAAYVSVLIWAQGRRSHPRRRVRADAAGERLDDFEARLNQRLPADTAGASGDEAAEARLRGLRRRLAWMRGRMTRMMRDLDYYRDSPLGWRHGTVIVWAGMRGVVTLAAAQTLPAETANRSLLVFVAFLVAVLSLTLQGFTLPWLVARLGLSGEGTDRPSRHDQQSLWAELQAAAAEAIAAGRVRRRDGGAFPEDVARHVTARLTREPEEDETARARELLELRVALIAVMRERLVAVSRDGRFSTAALRQALAELDADQLSLELRLDGED